MAKLTSIKLGLHSIANPHPAEYAVSLHCKLSTVPLSCNPLPSGEPSHSRQIYDSIEILTPLTIVYTPPHAATRGCNVFDEGSGEAKHVKQCVFDSIGGELVR